MNKKCLNFLRIMFTLTIFLFVLGLTTTNSEEGPLLGRNIHIEYHIC